jgi:hypothetical protein
MNDPCPHQDETDCDCYEKALAQLAAKDAEIAKVANCGQEAVCVTSPGCQRHWQERNRELLDRATAAERERDEARADVRRLTDERGPFVERGAYESPKSNFRGAVSASNDTKQRLAAAESALSAARERSKAMIRAVFARWNRPEYGLLLHDCLSALDGDARFATPATVDGKDAGKLTAEERAAVTAFQQHLRAQPEAPSADFAGFMAGVKEEALREGPAAVAEFRAFDAHFRKEAEAPSPAPDTVAVPRETLERWQATIRQSTYAPRAIKILNEFDALLAPSP